MRRIQVTGFNKPNISNHRTLGLSARPSSHVLMYIVNLGTKEACMLTRMFNSNYIELKPALNWKVFSASKA